MKVVRQVEPKIYYQAEAFHIAADVLHESELMKYCSAPFIVNASFALELYLKCFDGKTVFKKPSVYCEGVVQYERVIGNVSQQGHNLQNLFGGLPCEYKEKIVSKFDALEMGLSAESFFETNSKHFVSWRYGFEGNNGSYVASEVLAMLSVLQSVGQEYL
ncbi:hypothetical protein [Pseudoalteromonas piscicida]|uniref:hypothetical protein n=1 Tax=Pseudoalteromonas piscicida TaxID=43662 RepID=UPI001C96D108|nr:hypothetical protein [Pseudoalteromonas piscicida]QZO11368.1 hypothetical protein K5642_09400 [Pseudoalteromonas piscicida]